MVGCCVVCRSLPAASSAVQICQHPLSCGRQRQRRPLSLPSTTAIATATVDNYDLQKPVVVIPCRWRQWQSSSTAAAVDGGGGDDVFATTVTDDNRMVTDRPLLPLPPMLPPPRPCPCLRRHHRCSLCQRHRPSDAPVDGWLLCRLSPLACCVVHRPNLSAPTVVQCVVDAFSAGLPSPFADHCPPLSVALLPSINHLHRSCCRLVAAFSAHPTA